MKEQQDGVYYRLRGLQQQSRGKKDAYYQNRRFSQEVSDNVSQHTWCRIAVPVSSCRQTIVLVV